MSAAHPESAAAAHASTGAECETTTLEREARKARKECFWESCFAGSAGFAFRVVGCDASHHAPPAATRFSATPTHVVARRPIAGIRKKPAAPAPAAAPTVLPAYR